MTTPRTPPDDDSILWEENGESAASSDIAFVDDAGAAPTPNRNIITLRESPEIELTSCDAVPGPQMAQAVALLVRGYISRARDDLTSLSRVFPSDPEVNAALAVASAAAGDDAGFVAKRKRVIETWTSGVRPPGLISLIVRALESDTPTLAHAAAAIAVDCTPASTAPLLALVERETSMAASAASRALAALRIVRSRPRLWALGSNDTAPARFDALEALARLGDARGTRRLIDLLASPDSSIRASAACALGGSGDGAGTDHLLGLTLDPSEDVRCAAALALGECGESKHVFPLRRLLSDPSERVRVFAAGALAALDDSEGLPTLLAGARNTTASHISAAAAQLIYVFGHGAKVEPLLATVSSTATVDSNKVARIDKDGSLARARWRQWFKSA